MGLLKALLAPVKVLSVLDVVGVTKSAGGKKPRRIRYSRWGGRRQKEHLRKQGKHSYYGASSDTVRVTTKRGRKKKKRRGR